MDLIQLLPLPEEIRNKILLFACKSPHTGVGVGLLKKKFKNNYLDIPDNDKDLISFEAFKQVYHFPDTINIYLFTCFHNLTRIDMGVEDVRVTGNIEDLKSLQKLSVIDFYNKNVDGNIENLKSLNITTISLSKTGVTGDIANLKFMCNLNIVCIRNTEVNGDIVNLKSLQNLTIIVMSGTVVTGDIIHLKSLKNLTIIDLSETLVTGDITNLKSLHNLTTIAFSNTGVTGNIQHFESMHNLTYIEFKNTNVYGNIENLISNKNLECIDLSNTNVKGNIDLKSLQNLNWFDISNTYATLREQEYQNT